MDDLDQKGTVLGIHELILYLNREVLSVVERTSDLVGLLGYPSHYFTLEFEDECGCSGIPIQLVHEGYATSDGLPQTTHEPNFVLVGLLWFDAE